MKVVGGKLVLRRRTEQTAAPAAPTPAEQAQRARQAEQLAARIKKNLAKPFRERLRRHNNFLESLNTYFDVPKVGPFG